MRPETPQKLLELFRPDIAAALAGVGSPSYRYGQVFEHLLRRPGQAFSGATALPADARRSLDDLGTSSLTLSGASTAGDGTTKLLLRTHDGLYIEAVVMPYRERTTVCLSSQIGCPVGCAFCATGVSGFRRNLSVAEIVDQVRAASALTEAAGSRVSNLVYMGMGEPLLNMQAVLGSIGILTDPRGLDLAHRAISVSTVGIPAGIARLGRTEPQVNLALSLHASTDRTRASLIPEGYCHPLSEILAAAWEHFALTRRKLLIEYVLLRGLNDSTDDARRLAGLLRGHVVTVNLLSWNPVPQSTRSRTSVSGRLQPHGAPTAQFQPSPPAAVAAFRNTLLAARIEAVVRRSKGADIQAACGQLAGRARGEGEVMG